MSPPDKYTAYLDPKIESDYRQGTIEPGEYRFSALVYGEPSEWGIDNGRISKLSITDGKGKEIIEYDRGFPCDNAGKPVLPTQEEAQLIDAVKREFPNEQVKEAGLANHHAELIARITAEEQANKTSERSDDDLER